MTHILHIFWNVDMRTQHDGLAKVAKENGKLNIKDLQPGQMLCFINTKRDRIKVLVGTIEKDGLGILGYYKSPHGRIDYQALQYIPRAFGKKNAWYDDALKTSLLERLPVR